MLKKTVFILVSLVIVFGMAGSASATKPAPTTCWLVGMTPEYDFEWFEVEGKVSYNETAQVYNVSCRYKFDYDSGEWLDVATVCEIVPFACNPSHTMFMWNGLGWESEYGYTEDTTYQVNHNGNAKFFAQLAPGQCDSYLSSVSWTYLPLEEWAPGLHTYQFTEVYSDGNEFAFDPVEFWVDENAPLLEPHVRMGLLNLKSSEGELDLPYTIHPEQETFMQATYLSTLHEDMVWLSDNLVYELVIDDGEPITLLPGPVTNACTTVYGDNPGAFQRDWGYVR